MMRWDEPCLLLVEAGPTELGMVWAVGCSQGRLNHHQVLSEMVTARKTCIWIKLKLLKENWIYFNGVSRIIKNGLVTKPFIFEKHWYCFQCTQLFYNLLGCEFSTLTMLLGRT